MPLTASAAAGEFPGRILAPVEFSDCSAAAVRYAAPLAQQFRSELILVHVVSPPPPEVSEESYRNQIAAAEQRLEAFLAPQLSAVSVRKMVLKGDPARKIVQYAQNERADVVLIATHGLGPFRRFLLGSVTAKVLHDADCPVWTGVHLGEPPAHPFFPLRRILCAVDLGPQSQGALALAMRLQQQAAAQLTILHSAPGHPIFGDASESDWNRRMRASAEAELERLRDQSGATAELVIATGEPAEAICAAAERLAADLVVIGRGSAAGVFGRLRTNSYAIIRQSPCPVISV